MRFVAVLAVASLAGCAGGAPPARLRWDPASDIDTKPVRTELSISSAAADAPGLRVTDLPPDAAAAYVAGLAAKIESADDFRSAVAAPIRPSRRGDGDRTVLPRTIAIGLLKTGYDATHRLVMAHVVMEPQQARFTGYTLAQSLYDEVDLESVSVGRTTSAGIGATSALAGIAEIEASLKSENTSVRTYRNRADTAVLTVAFRPDRMEVLQYAVDTADIAGQILVRTSVRPATPGQIEYEAVAVSARLQAPDGSDLPGPKASMGVVIDRTLRGGPIAVCAKVDYVQRVASADSAHFIDEGLQSATVSKNSTRARLFELVPAEEVVPPLWGVADASGPIQIDTPLGPKEPLFESEVQASRFASWLTRTGSAQVGTARLHVMVGPERRLLRSQPGRATRVYPVRDPGPPFEAKRCDLQSQQDPEPATGASGAASTGKQR